MQGGKGSWGGYQCGAWLVGRVAFIQTRLIGHTCDFWSSADLFNECWRERTSSLALYFHMQISICRAFPLRWVGCSEGGKPGWGGGVKG